MAAARYVLARGHRDALQFAGSRAVRSRACLNEVVRAAGRSVDHGGLPTGSVTCNVWGVRRAPKPTPTPLAQRVRDHRQRLRAQGLRPIQIWVPDVRAPRFAAQAHEQSLAIATSGRASDDQAFIDSISLDEE